MVLLPNISENITELLLVASKGATVPTKDSVWNPRWEATVVPFGEHRITCQNLAKPDYLDLIKLEYKNLVKPIISEITKPNEIHNLRKKIHRRPRR